MNYVGVCLVPDVLEGDLFARRTIITGENDEFVCFCGSCSVFYVWFVLFVANFLVSDRGVK